MQDNGLLTMQDVVIECTDHVSHWLNPEQIIPQSFTLQKVITFSKFWDIIYSLICVLYLREKSIVSFMINLISKHILYKIHFKERY